MGVASLVLGIISILFAGIPFCGTIFILPALIGLFLGIAFIVEAKKHNIPHGIGIAGVVLNAISLFLVLSQLLFFIIGGKKSVSFNSNGFNNSYRDSIAEVGDSLQEYRDSVAAEIARELED